jgi:hypothetical protein
LSIPLAQQSATTGSQQQDRNNRIAGYKKRNTIVVNNQPELRATVDETNATTAPKQQDHDGRGPLSAHDEHES